MLVIGSLVERVVRKTIREEMRYASQLAKKEESKSVEEEEEMMAIIDQVFREHKSVLDALAKY